MVLFLSKSESLLGNCEFLKQGYCVEKTSLHTKYQCRSDTGTEIYTQQFTPLQHILQA